ncbi:MAG TPA: RNA methyltransferase [Rhodocyclaceae bacterium]|nr:RNA methyltransferase [Rhodocyclaceae bacterium]
MNAQLAPEQCLQRIRVVLSHPSHPGNIGAAARAMKTMGLSKLCLVNPKRFPDVEADARAAGAVDLLAAARIRDSLDEALEGTVFALAVSARQRDLGPPPTTARTGIEELLEWTKVGEVALVFGNETAGLANEEVQRCQATLTIPTAADFSSLNLGAAVQVLCYEARMRAFAGVEQGTRQQKVTPYASHPVTLDELEGFYAHLESLMVETGFMDPAQPKRLIPKLRRLFGRARLERDEVNLLRGILTAAQMAAKQQKNS